jgi:hypothetical protein
LMAGAGYPVAHVGFQDSRFLISVQKWENPPFLSTKEKNGHLSAKAVISCLQPATVPFSLTDPVPSVSCCVDSAFRRC